MHSEDMAAHNWLAKRVLNRSVARRLPMLRGCVVDLGCGTRPFEVDILARADAYIGVDWANSLHGTHADVIADLNKALPFADGIADHVVSFEVLEHLCEPATMLAEALRILKPGGEMTITVPFQWWVHEEPWDFFRYTRHGLQYLLSRAGFVEISVVATTGFWTMWWLKFNYQTLHLLQGPSWLRRAMRLCLVPVWWTTQHLATTMDRFWREDRETAGYLVTAAKP